MAMRRFSITDMLRELWCDGCDQRRDIFEVKIVVSEEYSFSVMSLCHECLEKLNMALVEYLGGKEH